MPNENLQENVSTEAVLEKNLNYAKDLKPKILILQEG